VDDRDTQLNLLERVTPARRQFVRDLLRAGFAVPAMATFSMSALAVAPLGAQAPHGS
jgi:hypothetical protein